MMDCKVQAQTVRRFGVFVQQQMQLLFKEEGDFINITDIRFLKNN